MLNLGGSYGAKEPSPRDQVKMRYQQEIRNSGASAAANCGLSRANSSAQSQQKSVVSSTRPVSHHQAMASPMRSSGHHMSPQHQQSHPAAPHLAELANNNHNKRRIAQTSHGVSGYHRDNRSGNVSASAAVAQSHLARVNASVAAASPQHKASESILLNGAINGSRPEVANFYSI